MFFVTLIVILFGYGDVENSCPDDLNVEQDVKTYNFYRKQLSWSCLGDSMAVFSCDNEIDENNGNGWLRGFAIRNGYNSDWVYWFPGNDVTEEESFEVKGPFCRGTCKDYYYSDTAQDLDVCQITFDRLEVTFNVHNWDEECGGYHDGIENRCDLQCCEITDGSSVECGDPSDASLYSENVEFISNTGKYAVARCRWGYEIVNVAGETWSDYWPTEMLSCISGQWKRLNNQLYCSEIPVVKNDNNEDIYFTNRANYIAECLVTDYIFATDDLNEEFGTPCTDTYSEIQSYDDLETIEENAALCAVVDECVGVSEKGLFLKTSSDAIDSLKIDDECYGVDKKRCWMKVPSS